MDQDSLPLPSLTLVNLNCNRWLAGFIDADGSFYIRLTQGLKKTRIAISFRLDQRIFDKDGDSYQPIMNSIAKAFSTKLLIVKKKQGSYLHIHITSLFSTNLLNSYLKSFPLITSKYCDYLA